MAAGVGSFEIIGARAQRSAIARLKYVYLSDVRTTLYQKRPHV
jgi:hypothetical protein